MSGLINSNVTVSRRHRSSLAVAVAVLAAALMLSVPATAQDPYNYTASLSVLVGGPLDASEPDPGLGNAGFQAAFSFISAPRTHVGIRLGRVGFSEELSNLRDPDLTFVNVGGEYRYQESYYQSGLFLGLGVYQLEGDTENGSDDRTAIGVALGATGDFPITRKLSFIADVSVHWADLGEASFFAFVNLGLGYHF